MAVLCWRQSPIPMRHKSWGQHRSSFAIDISYNLSGWKHIFNIIMPFRHWLERKKKVTWSRIKYTNVLSLHKPTCGNSYRFYEHSHATIYVHKCTDSPSLSLSLYIYIYIYMPLCVCACVCAPVWVCWYKYRYPDSPNPLLGQDMTQGQFLSGF